MTQSAIASRRITVILAAASWRVAQSVWEVRGPSGSLRASTSVSFIKRRCPSDHECAINRGKPWISLFQPRYDARSSPSGHSHERVDGRHLCGSELNPSAVAEHKQSPDGRPSLPSGRAPGRAHTHPRACTAGVMSAALEVGGCRANISTLFTRYPITIIVSIARTINPGQAQVTALVGTDQGLRRRQGSPP